MRSHYNGDLLSAEAGVSVTVAGWVHRRRDLGGLIFLQLRDRTGIVQVVIEPDQPELFAQAETLRNEFVVSMTGTVRNRPENMINKDMETGTIEILASELSVLNKSAPPAILIDGHEEVSEDRLEIIQIHTGRGSSPCHVGIARATIRSDSAQRSTVTPAGPSGELRRNRHRGCNR